MKIHLIISLLFATIVCSGQTEKVTIQFNDTTSLKLVKVDFEPINKNMDYLNKKLVVGIEGAVIFGTDGELPKSVLKEAILNIGEKVYRLDVMNMYNPWFGEDINQNWLNIEINSNEIRLTGIFSDGAGSYAAQWLIINNSHIRTILSRDEEILIGYLNQ